MAEEINNMLDEFVDDMKQALDALLDIIAEEISEKATGYPRNTKTEILKKYNMALEIYNKHFINQQKMTTSNCTDCGQDLDVPEGWHYCPECDIETYFVSEDNDNQLR